MRKLNITLQFPKSGFLQKKKKKSNTCNFQKLFFFIKGAPMQI